MTLTDGGAGALLERDLSGWARYPTADSLVFHPEERHDIGPFVDQVASLHTLIARGAGQAYGDAAINGDNVVASMGRLNRVLAFDSEAGLVTCEAGVTLGQVVVACQPRGWFLSVTPGSSRSTVGGCIACDVHGKNHHVAGSFSGHVTELHLLTATSEVVVCAPSRNQALFWATVGGMGLTGIILQATLQLRPVATPWMSARNVVTRDLEDTFRALDEAVEATYSVVWMDGSASGRKLGRGVVMVGEHAAHEQAGTPGGSPRPEQIRPRTWSLPFGLPSGVLTPSFVGMFNAFIYSRYRHSGPEPTPAPLFRHFYPLDRLDNWNLLYGRRGFLEYQVLLPGAQALDSTRFILEAVNKASLCSSFTSIKRMGDAGRGMLSFPGSGYAFSIDLPRDDSAMRLLDRLDEYVAERGGRVYLAKDSRLNRRFVDVMYPRRVEFKNLVSAWDPDGLFGSNLSRRLGLRD